MKEELADVINYAIRMTSVLDLDIYQIVMEKMAKNSSKYPVEKAKGISTKYDKL